MLFHFLLSSFLSLRYNTIRKIRKHLLHGDKKMNEILNSERTAAVISLEAIQNNYAAIRKAFPGQKILSVLKADAYGHGISGIAALCSAYTDQFAVATVEEGARLRAAGADKPTLLFGPVPEGKIAEAARLGLTFSLGSLSYAQKVQEILSREGLKADCHLKIDTGFNRTGFPYRQGEDRAEAVLQELLQVYSLSCLQVKGTYTHLPDPESDDPEEVAFTDLQLSSFREVIAKIRAAGFDPGICHALSTGGALKRKEDKFDMIRVGMLVYGQCDSLEHAKELGIRQALRWSSRVAAIREIAPGETVGYGRTFRAQRPTRLGVVSVGYADGYRRNYQGLEVLCGGKRVPILGRICMDFLMIDLTDLPDPKEGMEVVLLGSQGDEEITAMEIAAARESTCGEVTAAINERVPRYYR